MNGVVVRPLENGIKDKTELIKFINDNDDFWRMVDYIDWRELTDFGRHNEHHVYMNNSKKRLYEYINIKIRGEKIKKIEKTKYDNIFDDIDRLIANYGTIYKTLLYSLYDYFYDIWISGELNVSDDGYWDLRSSIIGYGKSFVLDSLENQDLIISIANNHNFKENFGYIFPINK